MAYKSIRVRLSTNTRKDGTQYIIIRYGGARCQTNINVKPDNWDSVNSLVAPSDKASKKKNALLYELIDKLDMRLAGTDVSDEQFIKIYNEINGKENKPVVGKKFYDYWLEFERTKLKPGTLKTYTNAWKKIEEFDSSVKFESLNKGWLIRFDAWLEDKGYSTNYRSIIMRCLRAVLNYCIDCEYTNVYPFRRFQIKSEPTKKRSLTKEQLIRLRDYPVEDYQEKYRDCFMLSFYLIGINMADLFALKKSDIVNGYISYRRLKTTALYDIKLEPEAKEIIDKYAGKEHLLSWADEWKETNFIKRMNIELQRIGPWHYGKGRGGKKIYEPLFPGLSTYWARHSWATLASKLDIPIDMIGRALGHADAGHTVTNIYVDFDHTKIDDANRKVLDSLKQ